MAVHSQAISPEERSLRSSGKRWNSRMYDEEKVGTEVKKYSSFETVSIAPAEVKPNKMTTLRDVRRSARSAGEYSENAKSYPDLTVDSEPNATRTMLNTASAVSDSGRLFCVHQVFNDIGQ